MIKRLLLSCLPALLLFPAGFGGWAIVTVDEVPQYLVAGETVTLRFSVRQHGVTLLPDLHPTIEARSGNRSAPVVTVPAPESPTKGRYAASLSLPDPGDWTITIHSGFGNSKLSLLPIPAIRRGMATPSPLIAAELGRRLFVGKGCIGCHTRNEGGLPGGETIGPELTGKRYQVEYISRFLTDPAANPTRTGTMRMPNLGLRPAEIASLVAFLNSDRQLGIKQ